MDFIPCMAEDCIEPADYDCIGCFQGYCALHVCGTEADLCDGCYQRKPVI